MSCSRQNAPGTLRVYGGRQVGCRVHQGFSTLNRRSRRRYRAKLWSYENRFADGEWSERTLQQRVGALLGFAAKPRSWSFRRRVLVDFGQRPNGLEPREARRQLEQQRSELPVGEPQQERTGEPEQQPGVPPCPSSDPGRRATWN
jgi:hypothetical protein